MKVRHKKYNFNALFLSLSLEDLVTALINEQVLIQLLSGILLGEQSAVLINGALTAAPQLTKRPDITGFIPKAPPKSIGILLHCLEATSTVAALFDDRPALKLLFQKLCGLEHHANLYKYTIAAQSVKLASIYEFARSTDASKEHSGILERSLRALLEALTKFDEEAAANKLASFARDRLNQKIRISLVENNEKSTDEIKAFSIVSAAKCLEGNEIKVYKDYKMIVF